MSVLRDSHTDIATAAVVYVYVMQSVAFPWIPVNSSSVTRAAGDTKPPSIK